MHKKKVLSFVLLSAICLQFTSCIRTETSFKKGADGMKIYTPTEKNIKTLGRTYEGDNTLWLAWSGSGLEFNVKAKKVDVTLTGGMENPSKEQEGSLPRFAIYVNDERIIDDMGNFKEKTYTVLNCDREKDVNVKVVKLSETAMSTIGVKNISV